MDRHRGWLPADRDAVLHILTSYYHARLDAIAIHDLADAIMPYLARTRQPFRQAVAKIAANYLIDGERVKRLMTKQQTPEQKHEWDVVLTWIIEVASKSRRFPMDSEAVSAPDLDAYDDIRRNIHSYNFEGPLNHWLTTAVTNRLSRYWRDQQTRRAGGHGIRRGSAAQMDVHALDRKIPPNAYHLSLDMVLEGEIRESVIAALAEQDTSALVESTELERIVAQELRTLANTRTDPLLLAVWDAITTQGLKLREAADVHGLTISQVHRRVTEARRHLQRSPQIVQWCDL